MPRTISKAKKNGWTTRAKGLILIFNFLCSPLKSPFLKSDLFPYVKCSYRILKTPMDLSFICCTMITSVFPVMDNIKNYRVSRFFFDR